MRKSFSEEALAETAENLLLLDETGFSLDIIPTLAYSPIGKKAIFAGPASKGQNLSVMCLIGWKGVIHFESLDGSYNRTKMLEFLRHCPRDQIDYKTIILDNARFHHCKEVIHHILIISSFTISLTDS